MLTEQRKREVRGRPCEASAAAAMTMNSDRTQIRARTVDSTADPFHRINASVEGDHSPGYKYMQLMKTCDPLQWI